MKLSWGYTIEIHGMQLYVRHHVFYSLNKEFCSALAYVNGVSEGVFKVGMCLPAGPMVSDDDVKYIVETIKAQIL